MPDPHDFTFSYRLRVRWAEVDRQDIVFNGHYLTYFDVGMTEYMRAIGVPYPDGLLAQDCDLFVVKATIEFKAPARYDDELDCWVRVGRIGRSSMQFLFALQRGDELLVSGENIYVNAHPVTRQPSVVPAFMRDAIARYERVAPEA